MSRFWKLFHFFLILLRILGLRYLRQMNPYLLVLYLYLSLLHLLLHQMAPCPQSPLRTPVPALRLPCQHLLRSQVCLLLLFLIFPHLGIPHVFVVPPPAFFFSIVLIILLPIICLIKVFQIPINLFLVRLIRFPFLAQSMKHSRILCGCLL